MADVSKEKHFSIRKNIVFEAIEHGAKMPWLIAQEDHPTTDLATVMQSVGVVELKRSF